ncbi:putative amidohydrolase [Hydrogenivirga caldilitoris]|uniref:Putative amidohydrolase n=1 Tax=Hydrogenivirga caldilitoris TaxID=246264 RepID=A0A497XRU9_9AQUI|nr:carbon-nitrogen hydrolase family protein [Hydrogenivirga caldilitoris]RLJ69862.1 putative amidohydrolase [Hydrogenivirga caldilitoris]
MLLNLATLQLSLTPDPEKNLQRVISYAENLPENTLLLLPEMFFCGFDYERLEDFASMTPEVLKLLQRLSEEKGFMLCGTLPERTGEGIRNTAFLIDGGKVIGKRSKMKLFPIFDEHRYFIPGEENPVFETRAGRIGILICFELRFTDMVLELRKKGVEILLVPAQWGYARREHLRILSQARAVELQSYVVVSDTWGEHAGTRYAGQSGIYSPWGEVLVYSEKGDVLLRVEADLAEVHRVREVLPVSME